MEKSASRDPLEHASNIKTEFKKLSEHLREDAEKVDDPQGKALFEVSAEGIDELEKALIDYERKNEIAWINTNALKA